CAKCNEFCNHCNTAIRLQTSARVSEGGSSMTFGEYVVSRWATVSLAAAEHALVVAIAIGIATVVGVCIGLLGFETPKLRAASLTLSAGILTVPSLALLTLLIPLAGLGWGPTLVALTAYAFLPIIRNTVTGLKIGRAPGMGRVRV